MYIFAISSSSFSYFSRFPLHFFPFVSLPHYYPILNVFAALLVVFQFLTILMAFSFLRQTNDLSFFSRFGLKYVI